MRQHMGQTMTDSSQTAPEQNLGQSYRLDDQVGYLMRLAAQRHAVLFQGLVPEGLTNMQFSALVRLAEVGECSQNLLGRLVSMDVATTKGVIDRLRAKELITVARDTKDLRRATIRPTQKALDMMDDLHRAGLRISEETLVPLNAKERETLIRLLRKVI